MTQSENATLTELLVQSSGKTGDQGARECVSPAFLEGIRSASLANGRIVRWKNPAVTV
jgi:hypothetical protein